MRFSVRDYLRALAAHWRNERRTGGGARAQETPWSSADAVFRRASIVPDGGAQRCVAVTRLSTRGARIEYYARDTLPPEFTLIEPIRGVHRRVRLLWQDEYVAGLAFVDAA